jgi:arsenate reductase
MVVFMVMGKDIRHMSSMAQSDGAKRLPRGLLFLCVQNSSRSQIAEGWARKVLPPWVRTLSAGSKPADRVNPYAVRVMEEVGIDIAGQRPKSIGDVPWGNVDQVITLCADEVCPLPPVGVSETNWALPDPAATQGTDEEILAAFRGTRDEIRRRLETLSAAYQRQGT